jgi:hypothetical protein
MSRRLLGPITAIILAVSGALAAPSWAQVPRANLYTNWNTSPDPDAYYGGFLDGNSAYEAKVFQLNGAGVTPNGVIATAVLSCTAFGVGGGAALVPCPPGTPFDACVGNANDGGGNNILLGVLHRTELTNPNNGYGPCPGPSTQTKMSLLIQAGQDPRQVDGVVTLSCAVYNGSGGASVVPCPSNPGNVYAYCIQNQNDGLGNSVVLGVIGSNGPNDPYTYYGECNSAANGVSEGFMSKIQMANGLAPLNTVKKIRIMSCGVGSTGHKLQKVAHKVCASAPYNFANVGAYDFCIIGDDPNGNAVYAAVSIQ